MAIYHLASIFCTCDGLALSLNLEFAGLRSVRFKTCSNVSVYMYFSPTSHPARGAGCVTSERYWIIYSLLLDLAVRAFQILKLNKFF